MERSSAESRFQGVYEEPYAPEVQQQWPALGDDGGDEVFAVGF